MEIKAFTSSLVKRPKPRLFGQQHPSMPIRMSIDPLPANEWYLRLLLLTELLHIEKRIKLQE